MSKNELIWVIGAGAIAIEYTKILQNMNYPVKIFGRGKRSAKEFEKKTGLSVVEGGIENISINKFKIPNKAIVAVNLESLKDTTKKIIEYGIPNILIEKPGGLNFTEIKELLLISEQLSTNIYIAYNRRFYSSVEKLREIIQKDGGIKSLYFEFTEWSHLISKSGKSPEVLRNWFFVNSSHVIDLVFHLIGTPSKLSCYSEGTLHWHPNASKFVGSGKTKKGVLFSYHANWEAPGRWGIDVFTNHHKITLRPLERLKIQKTGEIVISEVKLNNKLDKLYKPGFYKQVKCFLNNNKPKKLLTIRNQYDNIESIYSPILFGR